MYGCVNYQSLKIVRFANRYFSAMSGIVKISDYDIVGFDLDNTLLEYNLTNIFPLQYEFLSKYLVEKKGYRRGAFPPTLMEEHTDFFQRGLFLDFHRGNVLHLRHDGYILKAIHGTRVMDDEALEKTYGESRKWAVTSAFVEDKLSIWDSSEVRTFLDFTDSIVPLVFARAVESVDENSDCSVYNIWPDLLESIVEMYNDDSTFIQKLQSNMDDYATPCNSVVLDWLKDLKRKCKLVLITGAVPATVEKSLKFCLGENYYEFFDLLICEAKKPGFFSGRRPFLTFDGKEISQITLNKEGERDIYRQGNWSEVYEVVERELGRAPRSLYIGDNPLQDVYAPTRLSRKIDVIAVVEEIAGEGLDPHYPHSKIVNSKLWGPFLHSSPGTLTVMGDIFRESARLVVPSLRSIAMRPIDYEHKSILSLHSNDDKCES